MRKAVFTIVLGCTSVCNALSQNVGFIHLERHNYKMICDTFNVKQVEQEVEKRKLLSDSVRLVKIVVLAPDTDTLAIAKVDKKGNKTVQYFKNGKRSMRSMRVDHWAY